LAARQALAVTLVTVELEVTLEGRGKVEVVHGPMIRIVLVVPVLKAKKETVEIQVQAVNGALTVKTAHSVRENGA
jgi:hypothetical protein